MVLMTWMYLEPLKFFTKEVYFDSDVDIQQKDYGAYGVDSNIAAEIESKDEVLLARTTARITGNANDNNLAGDSARIASTDFPATTRIAGYDGNDKLFGGSGADHLLGDRESSKVIFMKTGYFMQSIAECLTMTNSLEALRMTCLSTSMEKIATGEIHQKMIGLSV